MEDVCETGGKKGVKGTLVGRKVGHESNTYCGSISISCCALELWFYTHHSHLTSYPQSSQHTCSGEVVSLCENDFSVCGRRGRMHMCVCVGGGGGGRACFGDYLHHHHMQDKEGKWGKGKREGRLEG